MADQETTQRMKAAAGEILRQLGGNRFIAMTGARNFVTDTNAPYANATFKFMGSKVANHVEIKLNGLDLYDVKFFKITSKSFKVVSEHNNIYDDGLRSLFSRVTGLAVEFPIVRGIND